MLRNILRWARITKAGTDSEQFHVQQISYLGKTANAIIAEPYGHHANCSPDSLGLLFSVQDMPENKATIAWSPKNRPKAAEGEVLLYHPKTNSYIAWREGGNLEIITDANVTATIGGNIDVTCGANLTADVAGATTLTCPNTTINGNVAINGNLGVIGTMTNNGKNVGDTHEHSQGNDSNGNSEQNIVGVL
jgi:phage gp45-like